MIQITSKYSIAGWLDKWLIEYFNIDPFLSKYVKLIILIVGLIAFSYIIWYLTKKLIITSIHKVFLKSKATWDDILIEKKVFDKLASIIPALLIVFVVPYLFGDFPQISKYVITFSNIFIIAVILWSINAVLTVINDLLSQSEIFKDKPITSYIQVLKIFISFISGILILSLLLGKSPFYFIGAMGAMTAILLLIFKDTILGFVASIQMSVYDMVRVGDWISMPKYDADGDVLYINLNTVKVQNWDKTITTIPTYAFITDSFKNWRGMSNSGGRRIKRVINIKMSSFQFCDSEMLTQFKKYNLLNEYIIQKESEIEKFNTELTNTQNKSLGKRRLTNIGIFRVYAENYIKTNPNINIEMTAMVRQLESTSKGLPIEIYCFSAEKEWIKYENIVSDIFDHLLTIVPEFHLEVFEEPTSFIVNLQDKKALKPYD